MKADQYQVAKNRPILKVSESRPTFKVAESTPIFKVAESRSIFEVAKNRPILNVGKSRRIINKDDYYHTSKRKKNMLQFLHTLDCSVSFHNTYKIFNLIARL